MRSCGANPLARRAAGPYLKLKLLAGDEPAAASAPLQLPVPFHVDLLLPPRQHVLRRDVARGAVQSDVVVAVHVNLHKTPRVIERQRRSWSDALPFERFVPALDFPIR